ncbi:MAG: PAS domain S-box protein [Elusimicrobia bacterium]|nr:PAS domain S-box protein [Elusimicrobiota bacterium]
MRLLGPKLAKERKGVLGSVDRARRVSASLSFKTAVRAAEALDRLSGWAALAVLATAIGVLALWNLFPAFSFTLLRDDWIVMAPSAAAGFGFLAAALLFYVREPPTEILGARRMAGATVSGLVLLGLFVPRWGAAAESPFTQAALAGLAAAFLARCAVGRTRGRSGDALGGAVLFLIVAFIYFLICYCHGVHSVPPGEIPCPRLLSVVSTVLLAMGFLGSLGPDRFPARLFIGASLRSVLLRKLFPLAVGVVLVFVCVRGSLLAFLSGPAAAFWTLMVWSLIVAFIILQSSLVVGGELGKALQESEQNYTHLVQGLKDHAVFLLSPRGEVLVWNAGAELMTGYTGAEALGTSVTRLMASGEGGLDLESALRTVHATGVFRGEGTAVRSDGRRFWAEMSLSRLVSGKGRPLGVSVILRDASARKHAEQIMAQALLEKEVLLKEIHHRVKNNLQVIVSLLRLQADTVGDPKIAAFSWTARSGCGPWPWSTSISTNQTISPGSIFRTTWPG